VSSSPQILFLPALLQSRQDSRGSQRRRLLFPFPFIFSYIRSYGQFLFSVVPPDTRKVSPFFHYRTPFFFLRFPPLQPFYGSRDLPVFFSWYGLPPKKAIRRRPSFFPFRFPSPFSALVIPNYVASDPSSSSERFPSSDY